MKSIIVFLMGCTVAVCAMAKLPAPNDEAKAKAAEAAAKTAHAGKVDAYQLCKSQDKVAAHYQKTSKAASKGAASSCADPGPFVYTPAGAAPAAPVAAAPAAAPAVKKKP